MANLTAQDLIPLASVFNANIDHARFTGSHVEKQAKLEAVRQERESLEAAQRRRREIEIHYSRLQRIHLEKRLSKLSEPRPDVAVAARARLATDVANDAAAHVQGQRSDGAAAALDEARKNFSVALDRAEPKLRSRREWAQKDALKAGGAVRLSSAANSPGVNSPRVTSPRVINSSRLRYTSYWCRMF